MELPHAKEPGRRVWLGLLLLAVIVLAIGSFVGLDDRFATWMVTRGF